MTLNRIEFDYETVTTPGEIVDFLRAIEGQIAQHRFNTSTIFQGFVPSDYQTIRRAIFDNAMMLSSSGSRSSTNWTSGRIHN